MESPADDEAPKDPGAQQPHRQGFSDEDFEGKFGKVRESSEMFGNVRTCLDMFGHIRTCSDMCGHVRKCSEMLGNVRKC